MAGERYEKEGRRNKRRLAKNKMKDEHHEDTDLDAAWVSKMKAPEP